MIRQFSILLVLISMFSFSCERAIDLGDVDTHPILIVKSFTDAQGEQGRNCAKIHILKSVSVFSDDTTSYVDDARVSIYKRSTFVEDMELAYSTDDTPYYKTSFMPSGGELYKIVVRVDGFEKIIVESTFPELPTLKVSVSDNGTDSPKKGYKFKKINVNVSFDDLQSVENFYQIKVFGQIKGHTTDSQGNIVETIDDAFTLLPFSKKQSNGLDLLVNNDLDPSISGIFFTDKTFDGKQNVDLTFKVGCYLKVSQNFENIGVEFNAIGKEYYHYVKSLENQKELLGKGNQAVKSAYSNITNGYGVFSGISSSWETFKY